MDTPEAQLRREVRGSVPEGSDFRRSGTGQARVRHGSGRCVVLGTILGLVWESFWESFWRSFGDHFGAHFRGHFGDMLE